MTKNILDIKEQALEKIKSLQKLEPDFVLSWLGGLTDLEQKITAILYQERKALTIKNLMSILLFNTYYIKIDGNFREERSFPFDGFYPMSIKVRDKISPKPQMSTEEKLKIIKSEMKFPSFRRIDKSVQDLMTMGVVLEREEPSENKKIKGIYYLNPVIRFKLNKLKK